jgi:hypothetical protein
MDSITLRPDEVKPKQREASIPQVSRSSYLYEIVTFTVLILGVSQFTSTGSTTLVYIACGLVTAQAGQPIVKNLLQFLKERVLSSDWKKP